MRCGHSGRDHQIETVPQPEGDALHHSSGQVAQVVADGEPDEGASGERIGVWGPLPGEVGEEEQPVTAGRNLGCSSHQVVEGVFGGNRIPQPSQAAGRRQHHPHHVPPFGDSMTEGVDPTFWFHRRAVGRGEHDS